jgi:hypothetical protein
MKRKHYYKYPANNGMSCIEENDCLKPIDILHKCCPKWEFVCLCGCHVKTLNKLINQSIFRLNYLNLLFKSSKKGFKLQCFSYLYINVFYVYCEMCLRLHLNRLQCSEKWKIETKQ